MADFSKAKAKINVSVKIGDSTTTAKVATGAAFSPAASKFVNEKVLRAAFRTFEGLNGALIEQLSKIKAAAPK